MPSDIKKYYFYAIHNCEMCGSGQEKHNVLGQRLNQSQGFKPKTKSGISVSIKKCRNCELIFSDPLPVPENIQDHYGVSPETYWNEDYFKWDPAYFSRQITEAKKLLSFTKGMKALDVGAGIGKAMLTMEEEGFDVFGFEPSEPFYEKAITIMKIDAQKLKLGSIEELEYDNNFFDFITFGAVLEHLYHPAACIEKALKWLKPDGIIHIEVPSSRHLIGKLINIYYKFSGTNYVTNLSPMHTPYHLYEFGLKSFTELGKRLNFDIAHH